MPDSARIIAVSENARNSPASKAAGGQGVIATGGILGALAASSCCILPLVLTLFGVGGAWMANLRALAPYQPVFVTVTAVLLGYGFYLVYWKPKRTCAGGSTCARPAVPNRAIRAALWAATVFVLLTVSFSLWFPVIAPYLP